MTQSELNQIKEKIHFNFYGKDNLLRQAFTHSTFAKENPEYGDNEILEFLGDSALNGFVTRRLYRDFCNVKNYAQLVSSKHVGELSKIRANTVCKENLAKCISNLSLQDYLLLGKGAQNIRNNESTKENLCEAIIGAFAVASNWREEEIDKICSFLLSLSKFQEDYIEIVEDWCNEHNVQKQYSPILFYGPEHKCKLTIWFSNRPESFDGIGASDFEAKMNAAEKATETLDKIEMREFLPANEVREDMSLQQLNELYTKFDWVFDKPEFLFNSEPEYDQDGNPYWYCKCKVFQKEETAGGYTKKEAQRRAAFKMIANLLGYSINSDYNDGL